MAGGGNEADQWDRRFLGTFHSAAIGMGLVAPDGSYQMVNQALCDITGYTAEELTHTKFQCITHPDHLDSDLAALNHLTEGKLSTWRNEKRYIHKSGHAVWVLVAVTAVRDEQGLQYFVTQVVDRTAQKEVELRAEVQRRLELEKAAAEKANETKSLFLANMSHELRTPVSAIQGYVELIRESLIDIDDNVVLEDLARIQRAGDHLLAIVDDVLDLSKLEARRLEVNISNFLVSSLIDDIAMMARPGVELRGNTLVVDVDAGTGAMWSDKTRIRQILLNLLGNAGKFCTDGTVSMQVGSDRRNEQDGICFVVVDTGIGMSLEQCERVWRAFEQADQFVTIHYGGTGLGLAICRSLTELLGGEISVTSEPGIGSRFSVWLPRDAPVDDSESAEEEPG